MVVASLVLPGGDITGVSDGGRRNGRWFRCEACRGTGSLGGAGAVSSSTKPTWPLAAWEQGRGRVRGRAMVGVWDFWTRLADPFLEVQIPDEINAERNGAG